ncbi:hypothetical protein EOM09_05170 [bacterium]|nr:hypothetical protein [bacterium]
MTKYCHLCKRYVEPRRKIGAGTFILAFFTAGISLLFIPFYTKRCPICSGTSLSNTEPNTDKKESDNIEIEKNSTTTK